MSELIADEDDDAVAVVVLGDSVCLRSVERGTGHVQEVYLDDERQERFAQAYVAACHQAKANAAQAVSGP